VAKARRGIVPIKFVEIYKSPGPKNGKVRFVDSGFRYGSHNFANSRLSTKSAYEELSSVIVCGDNRDLL
jgi:hypothetical protein